MLRCGGLIMKKNWILSILIILLLISGCKTDPEPVETPTEEAPAEEPVETPAEDPPVEVVDTVTDEEIGKAEEAINKAEAAGAETLSPDFYLKANEDLENAKSLRDTEPDNARELLATSIENANIAYEQSIQAKVDQKIAKLKEMDQKLNDIEAEKFAPEDYSIVKEKVVQLEEAFNSGDMETAEKYYNSTLRAMHNLFNTLKNNINWIKILDRDTKLYIADAEEKEVFIWAAEELEKANYLYSEGVSLFNNYKLAESEKSLKEAKYWAFHSVKLSKERKRQHETDSLMLETLNTLEQSSQNRVLDENGDIIEAQKWTGSDYIEENPAPAAKADDFTEEESSLEEFDPDSEAENETGENDDTAQIIDGTTSVLGDEQETTLLEQAIELWKQGVKARAEGKYDIADEYFKQSKAYADAYSANAVSNEYIVKKDDTLWAISAKTEILDNPFLWTKLWRRNNSLIQNPDLIFPGQKLIIPPQ